METNKLVRWLLVVIGVLVLLNIGLVGWLFFGKHPRQPGSPMNGPLAFRFLEKELDLTDQQQQQVIASREKLSEKTRPLDDSVRKLRKELFALTQKPGESTVELDSIGNAISQLIAQLETNRAIHFREIRRICTPRQQQRFDEILQELAQRQGPPPGGPPGGPAGGPGPGGGPPPPNGGQP